MTIATTLLLHSSVVPSVTSVMLAVCVGLISGLGSGLCGVSPGGGLVVLSTLFLGAEQHLAQGISLACQVPPTTLSGVRRYREVGHGWPRGWLPWFASAFLVGGVAGAAGAGKVSSLALQWSYVGYLAVLDALVVVPAALPSAAQTGSKNRVSPAGLLIVGLLAGASSGYLGIGGGLAIVVGLTGALKVPQHQAQMISLAFSILPTTLPATFVYARTGRLAPWPILLTVIAGLWAGTDIGARAATRLTHATLRRILVVVVTTMATYMAWKAFRASS